jgi:uncharacterized membrane protein
VDSRRAEAFSDGVFAVAITVLVFNLLAIGSHGLGSRPYHVLLSAWPSYFAYVVSFLTIGIMWMNHHTMFAQISRVNRVVLVFNLILLMGVVAIPFPTALVAEQLKAMSAAAGHADAAAAAAGSQAATVAYGLVMVAISVGYALTWLYLAAHQDILGATRRIRTPRATNLRFTAGLGGYIAATLVAAFVSAVAALAIYGLLAIYYLFEHLPDPSGDADEAGPGFGDAPGAHDPATGRLVSARPVFAPAGLCARRPAPAASVCARRPGVRARWIGVRPRRPGVHLILKDPGGQGLQHPSGS